MEGYTCYLYSTLYRTGDFEYVREQLEEMIENCAKVDPFLKKQFLSIKKMAKVKIEIGEV